MTRTLRLAALAALAFPLAASAQPAERPDRADRYVERLTQRLDLTDAQAQMVRTALAGEREPGRAWALAADLAPTLSGAQRQRLRERPERREASGERGPRAEARAERREATETARAQALALSDAQVRALDEVRAERRRSALPPEVAEVLTDEQETVVLLHRVLTPRARGPRGAHRRGASGRGR